MRINIELPDWVDERHIRVLKDGKDNLFVLAGVEEVAKFLRTGPHTERWQVKTARCDLCGECCMKVNSNWQFGVDGKTGWCRHLEWNEGWKGYLCDQGMGRPMSCSVGDDADKKHCVVKWKIIE